MMRKTTYVIIMLVLMLGTTLGACFSASAGSNLLQVYVKNQQTSAPINNAMVIAYSYHYNMSFIIPLSNISGLYQRTFSFNELDTYTIRVYAPGFFSQSKRVDILGLTRVYFSLYPQLNATIAFKD